MNNLEYLNEISKSNRPVKTSTSGLNPKTVLKIVIGGVIAFALLAIISIATNTGPKAVDYAKQINLRTYNLSETLRTYNPSIKNSNLRAISISLSSVLTDASNKFNTYFSFNDIDPSPSNDVSESEAAMSEELNLTLNNAKLNGILDRIYLNQIQLQVALLSSLIAQALSRNNNDINLLEILQQYESSLNLILDSFQKYSNPDA